MDGAKDSDLKGNKPDTSFTGLTKLAIDFADGVIQGSETINQDVLDYIATKKHTPFLPYQSPDVNMDKFNKRAISSFPFPSKCYRKFFLHLSGSSSIVLNNRRYNSSSIIFKSISSPSFSRFNEARYFSSTFLCFR